MNSKRKPQPQGTKEEKLPTHPHLHFKERNSKQLEVSLGTLENKDLEHDFRVMMNANLEYEKRDKGRVWILDKVDSRNFLDAIEDLEKRIEEESESDDSDSSTDDELIQKALARRMKSETSHTVLEEPNISDSEMEDVLSLSRRLRYILSRLDKIEKHLGL